MPEPGPGPEPDPGPRIPGPAPEPEPEPGDSGGTPPARRTELYLEKSRVGNPSQGLLRELEIDLRTNASQGWRDPEYVASHCSDAAADGEKPLFFKTAEELREFARAGLVFDQKGRVFVARMWDAQREEFIPNDRCDPAHVEHHLDFCGRADIRRTAMKTYRDQLRAHLADAQKLRDNLEGQPGRGEDYDSIKGWCEFRNQGGIQ